VGAPVTGLDVQWAVASRTYPGEVECGDSCGVTPFEGGVLFAVVDGLGHGPAAAEASRVALETLATDGALPLVEQVRRCHGALRRTRGVVMSLASFSSVRGELTWMGVGNVEGALFSAAPSPPRAHHALLLRGGVVGSQLPPLMEARLPLSPGDTLLLATDGLRWRPAESPVLDGDLDTVARELLERHASNTDDALVLVARFRPTPA
jgi:serine/threonine protein phosphatase PrpC